MRVNCLLHRVPCRTLRRRFSVAEDVSTQQALKSSVQRSIKRTICDQVRSYSCSIIWGSDAAHHEHDICSSQLLKNTSMTSFRRKETCLKQNGQIACGKCAFIPNDISLAVVICSKDRSTFIVVEGEPVFFHPRDGAYFPTLRLLHKCGSH